MVPHAAYIKQNIDSGLPSPPHRRFDLRDYVLPESLAKQQKVHFILNYPLKRVRIQKLSAVVAQSVVRRIGSAEVSSSILDSSINAKPVALAQTGFNKLNL